jgi:hypothetical protein
MSAARDLVYATVRRVAAEEGIDLQQQLADADSLVDEIGLRSLHIARILAILEMKLGLDPFASGDLPVTSIRTVGNLCAAYDP